MAREPEVRGGVFVSYNGLLDPLGPSQVLPYVERIARDRPMRVVSFEHRQWWAPDRARAVAERLRARGIGWTALRYRQRPQLMAKALDLWDGTRAVRRAISGGAHVVHARGHMPMEIALRATKRHPVLFDIRGLQGEEYIDAGIWGPRDLRYWLLKRSEREFFRRAAGAVVLTRAIEPYVRSRFAEVGRQPPLEVIPSAVDLERFRFDASARESVRRQLGAEERTLFVYSGSLGTWYLADDMARFVRAYRDTLGRKVLLLWQLNTEAELAQRVSAAAGLAASEIRITTARPEEVAPQLCAADVGIALVKACFSKRASSPTKYGECLAMGLPLVMTRDVGDSAELEAQEAGVAISPPFDDSQMRDACRRLAALQDRPREHFRSVAERVFDIERVAVPAYRRLYAAILGEGSAA